MSTWRDRGAALVLVGACFGASAQRSDFPNIGRPATPAEVTAWDIDVRPDFKGLPAGSGSVVRGQELWENKCASCHGVFGESGEVFNPIVGGTTKDDVRTGRVARLTDPAYPGRTTLMKLPTLSSLWDYIHRAMPWAQPKSLSADEVYAATAYILHLGGVLPADFVLSEKNVGEVQKLLPNRDGMGAAHALWPGAEFGGARKPDVQGSACMADCRAEPKIASSLPDFARDAHGNLAMQNRLVGAQLGADTSRPAASAPAGPAARSAAIAGTRAPGVTTADPAAAGGAQAMRGAPVVGAAPAVTSAASTVAGTASPLAGAAPTVAGAGTAAGVTPAGAGAASAIALTQAHSCVACHGMVNRTVGPGLQEIARKYANHPDAVGYLSGRIRSGGSGIWGAIPMPPQSLPEADARAIAQWLANGAAK